MRKSLLTMYHNLKEANATTDFPNILLDSMYKILINKFKGVSSPWRQYTSKGDLADFKTHNRVIVGEAPDLKLKVEGGPYQGSSITDYKYTIALETFGRTFDITRETIINDDLDAINKQPGRFGRAAARTLVKQIVLGLEGDTLRCYDNARLFDASHSNSGSTTLANTAAGATAVQTAMTAIKNATDPSVDEKMGLTPKYLLVSSELEFIAKQLINSAQIWPTSTGGGSPNNVINLQILVEPFLTANSWYVMASPEDAPTIEVGFLNSKETPDLLMKKPEAMNTAGGDDAFGYELDDISYKVRYDFGVALAYYQSIYRGKA